MTKRAALSRPCILVAIVTAQFFCTSLWFAGNGVIDSLIDAFSLSNSYLGHLTTAVQFGFIVGTLLYALLTLADRYSPSKVFFVSALCGSVFNLGMIWEGNNIITLLTLRFMTGFFLAGIYPVGMKIASDYFEEGLGRSLGFLVGALVLGTALPHLLQFLAYDVSWHLVFIITSSLAILGALLILIVVPDGPYRKASSRIDLSAVARVFKNQSFRSVAFGYFGHMWELYAFWTFVPLILSQHASGQLSPSINIPLFSFTIIAIGGISCAVGGIVSERYGPRKVAYSSLLLSLVCCLASPLFLASSSTTWLLIFLHFWGVVVIVDSPLFSTLVAHHANPDIKGTALTIVTCIGFAITIVSIQLINELRLIITSDLIYTILAIGPLVGLLTSKS